jgi:hypothetical protein
LRQRQPVREAVLEQRRHDHRDCRDTHGDRGGPADPAQEWRIEQLSLGLTGPGSNPCADGFDEAILNQANDERPRAGFRVGRASRNRNRGDDLAAAVLQHCGSPARGSEVEMGPDADGLDVVHVKLSVGDLPWKYSSRSWKLRVLPLLSCTPMRGE